tara:strand:+ start:3141 stop:3503 length:363 start_codon:yes stop_codon:yes gene_type:complete
MTPPYDRDEFVATFTFDALYPLYLNKLERKGKTEDELVQVLKWLTGFTKAQLKKHVKERSTMKQFFAAAKLNPNAKLIKGVVCGHRVEDIENPLTRKAKYMDKLVDELARGKKMESILRK